MAPRVVEDTAGPGAADFCCGDADFLEHSPDLKGEQKDASGGAVVEGFAVGLEVVDGVELCQALLVAL